MIKLRPHNSRGHLKSKWIESYRTFSFPSYYDERYMNFSDLQTINDDRVLPGWNVPIHEHKNMEIFGYVVEGLCRHTDSHGNILDIPAGSVQRMSTGSGIKHTEGNASDKPCRYIQLWVRPNVQNTEPTHDWYQFTHKEKLNNFCNITEKLPIKQDAKLLSGVFTEDFQYELSSSRVYYLYVVKNETSVNGYSLTEGDGLSFTEESILQITNPLDCEVILFDLKFS